MICVLEEICAFIHNYFTHENGKPIDAREGEFTITGGTLTLDFLKEGNFYLIRGSDFNDGIHRYPSLDLRPETFRGTVYKMRIHPDFLALCDEIEAWQEQYGKAVSGPYQSESFGGYSYTLKSGTTANGQQDSTAAGWQGVFKARLNRWRKLNHEFN